MSDREEVLKMEPTAQFCIHWHYGVKTAGIIADNPDPEGDDVCLADQDITDSPANEQQLWADALARLQSAGVH